MFWTQKACDDWIKLGDAKTKYFFQKALRRRRACHVQMLKSSDGNSVVGADAVAHCFAQEWNNILN